MDIDKQRLYNLQISHQNSQTPGELITALGAMQAQDYPGALWAVGLRLNATIADVEKAVEDKQIVRTWPMRGTLHFVPPADIRWMLKLMTPKVITGAASRHRNLELDEAIFDRSRELLTRALQGGKVLSRSQINQVLENSGILTGGQRGTHICWVLAQRGVLCFGPHQGKEPTFTLLDEWLPPGNNFGEDEALKVLANRYFSSHGPAQAQDFGWWTGLKVSDVKKAIELNSPNLISETIDGKDYWMSRDMVEAPTGPMAFLLPGFDEYLLGYRDRSDVLHKLHSQKVVPGGNGMFISTIVINGQVVGTWKRTPRKNAVSISLLPFGKLSKADKEAIGEAAEHYGKFIGQAVVIV